MQAGVLVRRFLRKRYNCAMEFGFDAWFKNYNFFKKLYVQKIFLNINLMISNLCNKDLYYKSSRWSKLFLTKGNILKLQKLAVGPSYFVLSQAFFQKKMIKLIEKCIKIYDIKYIYFEIYFVINFRIYKHWFFYKFDQIFYL